MELYQNDDMFAELCSRMYEYYRHRSIKLKERDAKREKEAGWYHRKDMLGMMLYIDNFAGNMQGVKEKIPYLKECNINCLHLMPFLDTPKGRSDGGYAVADFRKVRPDLGTMKDLAELTEKCHEEDINVCMDFRINYISLFSYLFISYQMSAKPYFIGSTGIFTFCSRSHIGVYLLMFSLSNVVNFVVNTSMLSDALSLFWHSQ